MLAGVTAQNTASPFDLLPRVAGGISQDSAIAIATSSNPFDIQKIQPAWRRSSPTTPGLTVERRKPLTAREKESIYRRFLFITVLSVLIILTLLVTIFRILIEKIWKAFLNDNLLNQLLREQSAGVTTAYSLLYLMFLINAGIFLFLGSKHFGIKISGSNVSSLFICIGVLAGFFLLKNILLRIVGFVFPVQKEVSTYNFTIIVFNIVIGFLLVPAIMLTAYTAESMSRYVIYGTVGLLAATYLFRMLRGLFIANRFIAWHKFHFLLYLCAVEIAPLLIILKLILQQKGAG
jgi:hypothetical protein